jgi:N-glycosylase/DNA lyase
MSDGRRIVFENVRDFDARQVFTCGQAFRWKRECDGSYTGVAGDRAANIAFTSAGRDRYAGDITIRPLGRALSACADADDDRAFWEDYLDLKRDYGRIKRALTMNDAAMARAAAHGAGIRILRQAPWEALISFIISQNNNIARIKGCVERLCEAFGARIDCADAGARFAFPSIETLAARDAADLTPCRLGYRAKYVAETARQVMEAGGEALFDELRGAAFAEAQKTLLSLCGVGPKVASCILLFGLGRTESFPVDVWIARAMRDLYGVDEKDAAAYAAARFGAYAGIAQQYLFYYMQERPA